MTLLVSPRSVNSRNSELKALGYTGSGKIRALLIEGWSV